MLRPTKGTHIVLPNDRLGKKHAFVLTAKTDDRVFFSIPWFDRTLVGTTDTDYDPAIDGALEDIHSTQNDIDYLLESVKRTFPGSTVGPSDIQSSFAGLRPLVSEGDASNPSGVSREHKIWQEPSGLFSIAGGKYTTYRVMAQQMVDRVVKFLVQENLISDLSRRCVTHLEAIVMPPEVTEVKNFVRIMDEYSSVLDGQAIQHLQQRYGARWQRVADLAVQNPELRERVVSSEPDILAEVVYSRDFEMAVTFEDFLRRRTMLALKAPLAAQFERLQKAAKLFGGPAITATQVAHWQGLDHK
jgi:glycerol-3-phosphate dehydrogenase